MKVKYILGLLLILSAATADIAMGQTEYLAVFIEGKKVGHAIQIRIEANGKVTTSENMSLTLSRGQVPMTVKQLSEPMKTFERLIVAGRMLHDGDPILSFAIGNVTAKLDANENVFPRKNKPEKKIDPVIGGLAAFSRLIVAPVKKVPYCVNHGPVILVV